MFLVSSWRLLLALASASILFHAGSAWMSPCIPLKENHQRRLTTELHALPRGNLTTWSPALSSTKQYVSDRSKAVNKKRNGKLQGSTGTIGKEARGMNILTNYFPTPAYNNSLELHAVEQVDALIDLFNNTRGSAEISGQIVSKAFEGLIQRVYEVRQQQQTVDGHLLENLESLLWRIGSLNLIPTYTSVETLWLMQQQYSKEFDGVQETAGKQVGRSIHLLMEWSMWAAEQKDQHEQQRETRRKQEVMAKPPYEYVIYTFELARETNVSMSFHMWDLYKHLETHDPDLSRDFFNVFLHIVSTSPGLWKARQCDVLQDLERRYQTTEDKTFQPAIGELEAALAVAARFGRATEATWLFRELRKRLPKSQSHNALKLWFQAICKSKEKGSTKYVEYLLESSPTKDETSEIYDLQLLLQNRHYNNMALQKWSLARTPGAGARAQALFERMVTESEETGNDGLRPNEESLHHVVMAYLREERLTLQNIIEAHRFLQQSLKRVEVTTHKGSSSGNKRHWRTFDNLLEAYSKFYFSERAKAEADRLFQFFLLQHRDGNVLEEPDSYHLGHLLRMWNKAPTAYGARKSLEFFQLMDRLAKQGKIQNEPDLYNVRQLLGTLAQSGEPGHGEFSNRLLDRILGTEALPESYDSFVLGHSFWCVVKCNCNERSAKGLQRAAKVLGQLERLHAENSTAVRLTGASYKEVICGYATFGGSRAGEQAQSVLEKLEEQYLAGNRYAKLTWDIYTDTMKAWTKDTSTHNSIQRVEALHKKWGKLEQSGIPGTGQHPGVDMGLAIAHVKCEAGSIDRAEQILLDADARLDACEDSPRVTSYAWHALLDGISRKAPPEECAKKATRLFEKMHQVDRLGRPVAEIRSWAYESLMRSWSRSNAPNAVDEMEKLYVVYQGKVGTTIEPSIVVLDLLLKKYNEMKSREEENAAKAFMLYQDIVQQLETSNSTSVKPWRNDRVKPSRSTISLLLAVLGRTRDSNKYKDAIDGIIRWRDSSMRNNDR